MTEKPPVPSDELLEQLTRYGISAYSERQQLWLAGYHARDALQRDYDTLRENHGELQKEAAETKAELERLREAVRWFAASEDVNASLTHWVSGNSECDNEEPLQPDPAAALIKLHERDKP